MASADEPPSLRALFQEAESRRRALESAANATSPSYAAEVHAVLSLYASVLDRTGSLALFSPNEGVEDIATSSLPYLATNYTVAELVQRTPFAGPAQRKLVLRAARAAYERFLALVDGYGLVAGPYAKLLERYRDDEEGFAVAPAAGDAAARRAAKVASFRAERDLRGRLAALKEDAGRADGDGDEEPVRQAYLADVAYHTHKAFEGLDSLNREAEMLALAPAEEPRHPAAAADPDASLRLDEPFLGGGGSGVVGRGGGPLLSRQGRPLQPFTLVGSRADLARGVFRPGHNLPTMSIDEYLAEERRRGNMLEGGTDPPAREVDEDDADAVDRETYKAREWDDFKDDNRRGAGNTLNMG
ncbi:uncharacterized protein UV8b_01187 [Ustilaginoidea virens]|uniref:Uncharacterized protein n=1 Tax=Ustilaginoidea virens TaxID=1159556 RepID=A0A063C1Z6_USTVR|nr:uncharacterized protein UV8b_01187 [Ustilaginoidea virens]QUC16946.1 hypothetical protein UV8b_01187 [Ustilaginoidea virens]GAO18156.1 hypothetical protein UVI_02036620 [Ustilaginoidea virens]